MEKNQTAVSESKNHQSNIAPEHVDLTGGKCYGNLRILAKEKRPEEICPHECRLKEACISASRESRKQTRLIEEEVSYRDDMIPIAELEKQESESLIYAKEPETVSRKTDVCLRMLLRYAKQTGNLSMPEIRKLYPVFKEVVRQLFFEFVQMPTVMQIRTQKLVDEMSQAELARRMKVTRQAVNYWTTKEKKKVMEDKSIPAYLKGKERLVYQICFVDGCTERAAAELLRMTQQNVNRLKQKIREKNAKSDLSRNSLGNSKKLVKNPPFKKEKTKNF